MSRTLLLCSLLCAGFAHAQDATTPGIPQAPHPTLTNISTVWPIDGDADADGRVTVRYREEGEASFRDAMPLFRVPGGATPEGFAWDNTHSGSIFDVLSGTTYLVELTLEDPDGGSVVEMITVTTRPEPTVPSDANERAVDPSTFAAAIADAQAGDVLVLAAGTYPGFEFLRDGTAERPIVIRSAEPGAAIVDGELRLDDRSYVWLEGLTVNNRVVLHTTRGIVVRGCTIDTPDSGIVAARGGTIDSYICDNVVMGPTQSWVDAALGADGDNLGEGIQLAGPGNVICYNFVRGFRDAISTWEGTEAVDQYSIDILGNDIELGADDAIEADFTMGNVRVMRNRITNSFVGISGQPTLGGPAYFIRNAMFNVVYSPFKLHRGSTGDVALHNTVVKCGDAFAVYSGVTWSRAFFRNNIFLGGTGGGTWGGYGNGDGSVAMLSTADPSCYFDYDGYGSIGTGMFSGRIGEVRFSSLAEMRASTSEANAVELDMSIFSADVEFPADGPFPERDAPSLYLVEGAAAIDRGVELANVNDGYSGAAPDLGAYERGSAVPHYGPRMPGMMPVCGDGVRERGEECDDGNDASADGCSPTCTIEASTDDGGVIVPGEDAGRAIDDAGTTTTDPGCGCSVASGDGVPTWIFALAIVIVLRRWR